MPHRGAQSLPDVPQPDRDPGRVAAALLKAFFRIAGLWQLGEAEQLALLGLESRTTLYRWRKDPPPRLDRDKRDRIGNLLGIYKSLQILFPDPEAADAWVRWPNQAPFFHGERALDRMIRNGLVGLHEVRQYLNAERGGWA
jgi:hypothetical protein